MRYIDRRFLFPVAAVTAWAQQPSPAAAEAEAALRARAEQFFQLQVDKKYRQAEALVADDTKDPYYNGRKFDIKSFTIQRIELLDDNTRAKVTISAKVAFAVPAARTVVELDAPKTTFWKLENGQWVWYVDSAAVIETPFGPVAPKPANGQSAPPPPQAMPRSAPDISTLRTLVKVDSNSVVLTPEAPRQAVTVSNGLPGGVDLELSSDHGEGFQAELEKKHLEAGETTSIRFTATGGNAETKVVQVFVSPLGTQLEIKVTKR